MVKHSASRRWPSSLGIAALATVLGTILALIVGAEVASAASNVTQVSFTGSTQAANATSVGWTVGFTPSNGQGALNGTNANKIIVTFDSTFTIAPAPGVSLGSGFSKCSATASASAAVVTITLANSGGTCALAKGVPGQLTITSITNPGPCSCPAGNFSVSTSSDSAASPSSNVVILGPASQLAFTTQPSGGTGGIAFGTQPVVTIQDSAGNTITGNTSTVGLAITAGTGTTGAALTCAANPKAATSGVVTFAGCKIDKAGTGYTVTATDGGLTAAVSSPFTVSAGTATKVAFSVQPPATGTAGTTLATFQVAAQDANGNTVSSTDTIALSIATGPAGATFAAGSTTSVAAVGGVATFSAVVLNTPGSYTFTAADTSRVLTTATSSPATIVGAAAASKLVFVQGPTDVAAGSAFAPAITVQVQDQFGNPVSSSGVTVTLSSSAGPLDAGASATTDGSGRASFGSAQLNTAAAGLTLTASASGLVSATSATFNVVVSVTNGSPLTDTASDTGSGVRSVSYYYCVGYSGTCTNGTLIGTATSSTNNYLVNWTGQPANGAYRLVAVATDNVTNASAPSASIPIRISN